MNIYVDADSCPVVDTIITIARTYEVDTYIVRSFAHFSPATDDHLISYLYVDPENEAVDYKIFKHVQPNDIVITQDYGLASLILQKQAAAIHPKGFVYNDQNIDQLLDIRYVSQMKRKSGMKTKGPSKFTNKDRQQFEQSLRTMLDQLM